MPILMMFLGRVLLHCLQAGATRRTSVVMVRQVCLAKPAVVQGLMLLCLLTTTLVPAESYAICCDANHNFCEQFMIPLAVCLERRGQRRPNEPWQR